MKYKEILYDNLVESRYRLDSSFHLSDGIISRNIIKNGDYKPLSDITKDIFYGGRAKRIYVSNKNKGVHFVGSSDMLMVDFKSSKYISKKLTRNLEGYYIKNGWTLISRSGTIGNTVYASQYFEDCAFSEHIIRVIPDENIYSGFLYAFLSSKYGYSMLTQGTFGAVIQHIEPEYISDLPIPIFEKSKQEKIHNLILEASNLRMKANESIRKSHLLFCNKLGISESDLNSLNSASEKDLGNIYKRQINELTPLTLRARNYSERKIRIIDALKISNWDKLIDVLETEPFYGSRFKRIESKSNNGIELLSQGNLFDYKPKGRIISSRNIRNIEQEIVKKGTILIPGQGTLGENEIFARAQYVWGYLENKLIAGHAMRFIPNSRIQSGYLFCVLSSPMWFRLLRNSVYGTNLLGYIVPILNGYPIPRFDAEFELEISEIINSAYDKLTISILKENTAIKLVENEIESWQN
jgi:hypothetical protein